MRLVLAGLSTAVSIILVAGCSTMSQVAHKATANLHPVAKPSVGPVPAVTGCGSPPRGGHYVGYSVAGFPPAKAPLESVEHATGVAANVASFYIRFGMKLDVPSITSMCERGILPFLEIDTATSAMLRKIVDGSEDSVMASYALELGTVQTPIVIDFNHEFNGPWFAWGYKHVTASEFVAAWRHMVTVFRQNGANNVLWAWNPNVDGNATVQDLQAWYPGDSYVDWVALDGYFYGKWDTFTSVFYPTMRQIRAFTKCPFFIAETGANPQSGRVRAINSLFHGAESTPDLLGLIWFDYYKYKFHNWFINNDRKATSAFGSGAMHYKK